MTAKPSVTYLDSKLALSVSVVPNQLSRQIQWGEMVRRLFHIWHIIRDDGHQLIDDAVRLSAQLRPGGQVNSAVEV